jgi:hypothetical protein
MIFHSTLDFQEMGAARLAKNIGPPQDKVDK